MHCRLQRSQFVSATTSLIAFQSDGIKVASVVLICSSVGKFDKADKCCTSNMMEIILFYS